MCVSESSSELDDTGESDIEEVATSALFTVSGFQDSVPFPCGFANSAVDLASCDHFQTSLLSSLWQKKYTPPKRGGGRSSAGSPNTGVWGDCL